MKISLSRIQKIPRFRKLSNESKAWLSEHLFELKANPGQYLIQQDSDVIGFTIIETGYVKWEREVGDGGYVLLDIYGPYENPGEPALIADVPYSASAIALTETVMLQLSKRDYNLFNQKDLHFCASSSYCLANRTQSLWERIEQNAKLEVEGKLAAFLLRLAFKFGQLPSITKGMYERVVIPFSLARTDFANAANCRSETAIRTISKWKKNGWILEEKSQIEISKLFITHYYPTWTGDLDAFGSECKKCRFSSEVAREAPNY